MRLRKLFEALGNEAAIIFGRFNPPHKGHRAAWELASRSPIWYVGTNKSTQGPKDPLPFDVKVEAMKTIWPEVEGHIVAEQSWLTLASMVYSKHGDVRLLCLTDEDWVTKTIQQYNGKEGAHGFYNFKKIEQKPTPRLSSATALRAAVEAGDRDAFAHAAGVDADTPVAGKPFFDLVAEYLLPYASAPKKAPAKKKKAAEPVSETIVKVKGGYQLQSKKTGKNLGTYPTKAGAEKRERQVQYFKHAHEDVEEAKDPCWKGYKQIGMKQKGGKQVPNCVPKESVEEGIEDQEYVQQIAQEFIRRAKLGRHNADEGTIIRMLSKFFDKFGINDHYFDIAYHKIMNIVGGDQPTEDAAGVGIITKQNTTADVNKGTLRKMMKGYHLTDDLEETLENDEFYETYGIVEDTLEEAEYQGRSVPLNKPMRGDVKKFKVYVKDPSTGNVKKVNFGDPNMKIKAYDPERRRSFRARHNCNNPGPKTKARYWSCRKW